MTTRTIAVTLAALAALAGSPGAASAGTRPTAAEAKKTIAAWIAAMELDVGNDAADPPSAAAIALTGVPFHAAYFNEPEPGCPDTVAADAAATTAALGCLKVHVSPEGKLRPWTSKLAKASGIPYRYKKELRALAKTATLAMVDECAGEGEQVVFAVTKDKAGTFKVVAVLSQHVFCGE